MSISEFKQRFYKVSEVTNGISQADAKAHCEKYGMDLPKLKTPFEGWLWKKEISGLINNMAWLGSTRGMSCLLYTSPSPRDRG